MSKIIKKCIRILILRVSVNGFLKPTRRIDALKLALRASSCATMRGTCYPISINRDATVS